MDASEFWQVAAQREATAMTDDYVLRDGEALYVPLMGPDRLYQWKR